MSLLKSPRFRSVGCLPGEPVSSYNHSGLPVLVRHRHLTNAPWLLITMIVLSSPTFGRTTWYVDDDMCPQPGVGSEAAPFCSIQSAIDAASESGDEIVVAPGTYHEAIDLTGRGVYLRSSDGAEVTTIDASGVNASVVTIDDDSREDVVLEGFTITGGTGTPCGWDSEGNETFCGGGAYWRAGGRIERCVFVGNHADCGGGVNFDGPLAIVMYCTFRENTAGYGGGVYFGKVPPHLFGCVFERNFAEFGGAVKAVPWSGQEYGVPAFEQCTFTENTALYSGGAIRAIGGDFDVWHCTFARNRAPDGGAIYMLISSMSPVGCLFLGNVADYAGGAIYQLESDPTIESSVFVGNSAGEDGAVMRFFGGYSGLTNCSLVANDVAGVGAVSFDSSNHSSPSYVSLRSCVFRNGGNEIVNLDQSHIEVKYCNIEAGYEGTGNFDASPGFVRVPDDGGDGWIDDPMTPDVDESANNDYGDLRLTPDSPCINAGTTDAYTTRFNFDASNLPRKLCGRIDVGAYEYGVGDFDCDRTVGLDDLTHWMSCQTQPAPSLIGDGCETFDFNHDVDVDLRDLADLIVLVEH